MKFYTFSFNVDIFLYTGHEKGQEDNYQFLETVLFPLNVQTLTYSLNLYK